MNRCDFSPCRRYRYTLWHEWSDLLEPPKREGALMVIGLNPSTADENQLDPTLRRCVDFAKRWGFGALCMTNLFAWRDTLPRNMKAAAEPIGPENDRHLIECAHKAGLILAAWGAHGAHLGRATAVVAELESHMYSVHCLVLNKDRSPKHPLYVPAATVPIVFGGRS